ncbi:CPBP family glutamic-type intramembrane protease [Devosia submarina]|uniref:CPBP family glutamic-type intramembrane protease n=1 Tax=Devosia submarina TaxID=1173082 RepID=UPI000D3BFD48|nr:CPBP family glutamic-type intramembrane protease [Devosia submarina]
MPNRRQVALVLHALACIAGLAVATPHLTRAFGAAAGPIFALLLQALLFCLPVIAFHVWRGRGALFSERLHWRQWWIVLALLGQLGLVTLLLFVPNTAVLTTQSAMLAAMIALLVAPLEEIAWRGGFLRVFPQQPPIGLWLGWLLCSAAQLPVLYATGADWPFLASVMAVLTLFWSALAWRTGSVFWTAIAHTLTDILLLWLLLDRNALG